MWCVSPAFLLRGSFNISEKGLVGKLTDPSLSGNMEYQGIRTEKYPALVRYRIFRNRIMGNP